MINRFYIYEYVKSKSNNDNKNLATTKNKKKPPKSVDLYIIPCNLI